VSPAHSWVRWLTRALLWIGVVAVTPACILFAGGASGLETSACTFQGQDTQCGGCVVLYCQTEVNACCDDATCSGGLSYLDGCASDDGSSCYVLEEGGQFSGSPFFASLGACIQKNCSMCSTSVVPGLDASLDTGFGTMGIVCDTYSQTCTCEVEIDPTSSSTCTASTFKNGICCADINWPASYTSCTCSEFSCTDTSGDCFCTPTYDPSSSQDPSVCAESTGTTCCTDTAGDGQCTCYQDGTCDSSSQYEVSECTPQNTGCGAGQMVVDSCTN
jgi:hypothetical protein